MAVESLSFLENTILGGCSMVEWLKDMYFTEMNWWEMHEISTFLQLETFKKPLFVCISSCISSFTSLDVLKMSGEKHCKYILHILLL